MIVMFIFSSATSSHLLYLVKHHHADRKQVQGNVAPCQHRGEDLKGLFFEKNFNDNEREDVNGQVGKAAEGVPPLEVPLQHARRGLRSALKVHLLANNLSSFSP